MPLIILTGHPSSGKTFRANQIQVDFESRISKSIESTVGPKRKVIVIPSNHSLYDPILSGDPNDTTCDQSLNPRDQLYSRSAAEKVARAEEFSAIKRALNKTDVVIADGLNYIKGFRYQLWCEAKAAATRCVVVHVAAREDECKEWNQRRLNAWGWGFPEDDNEDQQEEQMKVGGVNVRVGRNVMGELEPESHTAIYGDKVVDFTGTRSRSSSMGGAVSDEDEPGTAKPAGNVNGDAMTLKSLYISDSKAEDAQVGTRQTDDLPSRHSMMPSNVDESPAPVEPPASKSALPYAPSTLKSLMMRYEPPSPFTRWDTPLFTVPSSDLHAPYEAIWNAIFPPPTKSRSKKALSQQSRGTNADTNEGVIGKAEEVRQHAATILPKATTSDALQTLESSTADVVKTILSAARDQGISNGEGGQLNFTLPSNAKPTTSTTDTDSKDNTTIDLSIYLPINKPLSQPMLQRLRRKYTQIQRGSIAHGKGYVSGRQDIIQNFTLFLESEWSE